ncbi:rodlin [Streptomyces sp. NPDC003077]|uniref:rodlin n=1 Tax=Streptomyces sp. NPDC003077 TaxID=3154443 RepID=UPI0033B64BAB
MIKKLLATTAVAASVVGVSAAAAPQAMAIDTDLGPQSTNGNATKETWANASTGDDMSPQLSLLEGVLNKPCIAWDDLNIGSVVGLIPITVQDIEILSSEQHQTCVENSTEAKEDDVLANTLRDFPLFSRNNADNG